MEICRWRDTTELNETIDGKYIIAIIDSKLLFGKAFIQKNDNKIKYFLKIKESEDVLDLNNCRWDFYDIEKSPTIIYAE